MGVDAETIRERPSAVQDPAGAEVFLLIDLGGERIWSGFGVGLILPHIPKLPRLVRGPVLWADVSHDAAISSFDANTERPPTEPKRHLIVH